MLTFDPDNPEARAFLAAAERGVIEPVQQPNSTTVVGAPLQPTSFGDGRYEIKQLLGEGGKKRVYLAHDTLLDRDVAFALIKTEGLDDAGRQRIRREARAMGRLGDHPHIVSVLDLGEQDGHPISSPSSWPGAIWRRLGRGSRHRLPLEQALALQSSCVRRWSTPTITASFTGTSSPGNVWLTADGTAKLGDFGLAVALDRSRLTRPA